jgi:hypothetical protein
VLNLKHLLSNDVSNSHHYLVQFLKKYYSLKEIKNFSDVMLNNWINAVLSFESASSNLRMREFIDKVMELGPDFVNRSSPDAE